MKQASNKKKTSAAERIDISDLKNIEIPYQDDWFFETTGPQGQRLVYLRFQATGWTTRRIGPYSCREDALVDLNLFLSELMETIEETVVNCGARIAKFPFQGHFAHFVLPEDPYHWTRFANGHYEPFQKGA